MQLKSTPITIDTYLNHYGYTAIISTENYKLVQLKNLKLVQIESSEDNSYTIQELTLGKAGELWSDISVETAIEHIQMLEGGNDTFFETWCVDDVLSLDPNLSRDHARLVLSMVMDNHDGDIGINWDIIRSYIHKVLEMKAAEIIV
jgi:hypothetical protein